MKATVLFGLFATLLATSFGETTCRLALRDEAGHFLGADSSVAYCYKVYDLTQEKYLHVGVYRYPIEPLDGGTHNVSFTVNPPFGDDDFRAKAGDRLRLEIYDASRNFERIGSVDGLPPVSDDPMPILTPMITALDSPGTTPNQPIDLVHQLADDFSSIYYELYLAGQEEAFGGGWEDEGDRDGDGLSNALEWKLGTDPYGGALSKDEVRETLEDAGFPDLARPDGFKSELALAENGLVMAAFTTVPGHAYGVRWLKDLSDGGVCLELCDENGKPLGAKAQTVDVAEVVKGVDRTIFGRLDETQMTSGYAALTVDGFIVATCDLNVSPYDSVGVRVNGLDVGRGEGWGWTYADGVLALSGRSSYSLAGTNLTGDVRVEVKTDLALTFNRLVLANSSAPVAVDESACLTIAGGNAKLAGTGEADIVSSGPVTVEGGNVSARLADARSPDGRTVWCVRVPEVAVEDPVEFKGLPAYYQTSGISAADGELSLWLPDGVYRFTVNGKKYYAEVAGAAVTALGYWPVGVYVDGQDIGFGFGEGWTYSDRSGHLVFTNCTRATLSGTNEASAVEIGVRSNLELFFDRVRLVNDAQVLSVSDEATLTFAGGTAKLVGGTNGVVVSSRPVVVAGGSFLADLMNGVAPSGSKVWRVTVSGLETEGPLEISGLPAYYRTDGIYAVDGKVCLWLPDGAYCVSVNGVSYLAKVEGSDAEAFKGNLIGLTVNGLDVAYRSDEGWALANDVLNLTGTGPFVLSGTDAAGQISVLVDTDATVTFDNLSLACKATPFTVATHHVVTLLLKGESALTAKKEGRAAVHVYETSSLVIDRAEGCTDAEAQLVAYGGREGGAGIGCGKNEMMGDIEIKGGTVAATGGMNGAGIGAGDGGGAGGEGDDPKRARIVVSGGVVTAQGGREAAGIGCGTRSWGPQIEIAGGRVKAVGGTDSYSDVGAAFIAQERISKSYTTIAISGGTVEAERLGSMIESREKAQVTITGGSALANAVAPDPTNGVAMVYRVTVEGLTGEEAVTLGGLPEGYGTNDIFAVDGTVCLWLPNGVYRFTVNGKRYYAEVAGAAVTALDYWPVGVYVDGQDIGHGSGEGWAYSEEFTTLAFTNCTGAALSGTNETSAVKIVVREDLELFFDRVKLVNDNHVLSAYDEATLTFAGGTATLVGGSEGVVVSSRPVVVAGGSFLADLTNGVAPSGSKAWCVTVSGLETEGPLEISGLPAYYRTDGIYAVDGKVCLWLPDGTYGFSVNGVSYLARVDGADTEAFEGSLVGLTVNGVDVAFGFGDGWSLTNNVLNVTGEGSFVLSGTDADERISVLVDADATVAFDNLSLTSKATPFTVATNRVVTLLLKGDNSLTARGDNCAAVHAYETSSLVIDRAEDCTDAEARLVALGGRYGAGIGCGMWEMMGDIEIKGGTIEATGGYRGAGIGAGQGGGAGGEGDDPKRAKIVISGGVVTAQGGDQAAGIGCGWSSWGPQIEIAGGRIKATEGINSYADIGSAPTASTAESAYTTIAISGGTIESGCLGWTGYNPQGKAKVTITGGSVLATAVAPSPTNGVATVHRVTVEGLSGEAAVSLGGLPTGYGTRDIFAVNGKVCLWLPDGRYVFSVDGEPYLAKVSGSDVTAQVLNLMAVIRMGEDGHAIVEPSEYVEGCTYSVKASETLDFTDCAIVPVGRIEDLRYRFFRVIVEAVSE